MLGLSKLGFGQFVDEANNLTYGWLVSRGAAIYRDVFAQHFPFPYYWSAIIIDLFGNSQIAVRVSLLILQTVLLGFSMWATGLYLPIGIAALAWGLTSQFHRGNMVLYDVFDGTFMTVSFILAFSMLLDNSKTGRARLIFLGICLVCALLSNPLMIYPASAIMLGVLLSGLNTAGKLREGLRRIFWVGGVIGVVLGAYLLYLSFSGAFPDFYRDTIWFNATIYNKYTEASPNRFDPLLRQIGTGLGAFNPQWRKQVTPFIQLGVYRNLLADEDAYYSWIFSSLLFRLSILVCVAGLLLKRKFLAGILMYVFSATLLIREETSWHIIPFIWVSLFAGAYFLVYFFTPPSIGFLLSCLKNRWQSSVEWVWRAGWRIVYAIFLIMYAWSAFYGAYFLVDQREFFSNQRFINRLERFGEEIHRITCNQDGVEILEYPYNPMVYFVTKIPPATRYTFMLPWVAEAGLSEVITELRNHPSAVVELKTERQVWQDYQVKDYLAELITFLNQNYQQVDSSLWVSKELAQKCNVGVPRISSEDDSP